MKNEWGIYERVLRRFILVTHVLLSFLPLVTALQPISRRVESVLVLDVSLGERDVLASHIEGGVAEHLLEGELVATGTAI